MEGTTIYVYNNIEMTKRLGFYEAPELCKKVLKMVAIKCEQPVRNLRKIPDDVLIGNYDQVEAGNYYVELYEGASSDTSLQGFYNNQSSKDQQGVGLEEFRANGRQSIGGCWVTKGQEPRVALQSKKNMINLSQKILEEDELD